MINQITLQAVEDALAEYGGKGSAKKYVEDRESHPDFLYRTEACWQKILLAEIGWVYKERALRLWHLFHPEHFDREGWIDEEFDNRYDLDTQLSYIAVRKLERHVKSHPEKQLNREEVWEYLNKQREPQQLRMF